MTQFSDACLVLFLGELCRFDWFREFACSSEIIGFPAGSAFFQGDAHFLESIKGLAVLAFHAEGGFGEESAAVGSDFVDGAGFVFQERTVVVYEVLVVFDFVCFPYFAQLFEKALHLSVNLDLLFGFGVDFSSRQKILQFAAVAASIAQERQVD